MASRSERASVPWDAASVIHGSGGSGAFRPGASTDRERLVELIVSPSLVEDGGRQQAVATARRWINDSWGELVAAKDETTVFVLLDGYDDIVQDLLREHEQVQRKQRIAGQQRIAQQARRRRQDAMDTDPGPVSSQQAGRRWAADSALEAPLYHATPYGDLILKTGLKARGAMKQRRQVLGGGPDDVVSMSPDLVAVRRLAAALQAINESHRDAGKVFRWFERHWLPWLRDRDMESGTRSAYVSLMRTVADKGMTPGMVKLAINDCSYFVGHNGRPPQPWMVIPGIFKVPPRVAPSSVGVVMAMANVDAVFHADVRTIGSPVAGLARKIHRSGGGSGYDRCSSVRAGGDRSRFWASIVPDTTPSVGPFPWTKHAALARISNNPAEANEIRVCGEDLTVVGFEPVLDWRKILMPPKKGSRSLLSTLLDESEPRPTSQRMQRNRCVVAVYDSLVERGRPQDHDTVSAAFAICNAQLARYGYLRPGTVTPTISGWLRSVELAGEDSHDEIMERFEALMAMAKRSRAAAKRGLRVVPGGKRQIRRETRSVLSGLLESAERRRGAANTASHPLNDASPTRGSRRCGSANQVVLAGRTNAAIKNTLEPLREAMDAVFLCETAYGTCNDDAPSAGHCMIASMAVQDLFGGEIVGGEVNRTPHYWNRVNGRDLDLTGDQFGKAPIQVKRGVLYPPGTVFSRQPHERVGSSGSELAKKHHRFMRRFMKELKGNGLTDYHAHLKQYGLA